MGIVLVICNNDCIVLFSLQVVGGGGGLFVCVCLFVTTNKNLVINRK